MVYVMLIGTTTNFNSIENMKSVKKTPKFNKGNRRFDYEWETFGRNELKETSENNKDKLEM